jgi:hypothetical protein
MVKTRVEWPEPERIEAIAKASSRLFRTMAEAPAAACVWSLCDVIWPGLDPALICDAWLEEVTLALAPLSRIGQMEGRSGSLVLVGRFWLQTEKRPSNPLIVKTRLKTGQGTRLADEWTRARAAKPHTYDRKDCFAIPVAFDDDDYRYEVLWSLCMPTTRESEGATIDFGSFPAVSDLRALLAFSSVRTPEENSNNLVHAGLVLERTYSVLRNLHRAAAAAGGPVLNRADRSFGAEYEWYLRRYDPDRRPESIWGPEWASVWAAGGERTVRDKINPIWLVERLRVETAPMQLGTIHGDLHPGNVILRDGDPPAIIDFGWSATEAHIAKDFVLMECNLRFLTLRPQVAEADLAAFATWLAWDAPAPVVMCDHLADRSKLVQLVRRAAHQVFADDTDWDREYLAPLFIVTFGLLRFAPQLGNQRAAICLVESLAQHLANALDLR